MSAIFDIFHNSYLIANFLYVTIVILHVDLTILHIEIFICHVDIFDRKISINLNTVDSLFRQVLNFAIHSFSTEPRDHKTANPNFNHSFM